MQQEKQKQIDEGNKKLYSLLEHSLAILSDGLINLQLLGGPLFASDDEYSVSSLAVDPKHQNPKWMQNCKCFGKLCFDDKEVAVNNSNSKSNPLLLLCFLWNDSSLVKSQQEFRVSFYLCTRERIGIQDSSELTGSKVNVNLQQIVNTNPTDINDLPIPYAAKSFIYSLKRFHDRNFVKVVYSILRDSSLSSISPTKTVGIDKDIFSQAMQLCDYYAMELDISQYVDIVSRYKNTNSGAKAPIKAPTIPITTDLLEKSSPFHYDNEDNLMQLINMYFTRVSDSHFFFYSRREAAENSQDETLLKNKEEDSDGEVNEMGVNEETENNSITAFSTIYSSPPSTTEPTDQKVEPPRFKPSSRIPTLLIEDIVVALDRATAILKQQQLLATPNFINEVESILSIDRKSSATGIYSFPCFFKIECVSFVPSNVGYQAVANESQEVGVELTFPVTSLESLIDGNISPSRERNKKIMLRLVCVTLPFYKPYESMVTLSINSKSNIGSAPRFTTISSSLSGSLPMESTTPIQSDSLLSPKSGLSSPISIPFHHKTSEFNSNLNGIQDISSTGSNFSTPRIRGENIGKADYKEIPLSCLRKVLREVGKSLRCLFSGEILHSLRSNIHLVPDSNDNENSLITRATLEIVLYHIKFLSTSISRSSDYYKANMRASYSTSTSSNTFTLPSTSQSAKQSSSVSTLDISLNYIDARSGRKIFPKEIENSNTLFLTRLVSSDSSDTDMNEKSENVIYYYDPSRKASSEETMQIKTLPYWLIITYHSREPPSTDSLKVYFHTSANEDDEPVMENNNNSMESTARVEKSRVFSELRIGIRKVMERINQLQLLQQLYETRYCSPFLVSDASPVESDSSDNFRPSTSMTFSSRGIIPPPAHTPKSNKSTSHSFRPGELSCPKVHEIQLLLHPRVPAPKAIGALIATALHPLSVLNAKNLFVYKEQKSGFVFYLKLNEAKRERDKLPSQENSLSSTTLNEQTIQSPENIATSSSSSQIVSMVVLEVYGVDSPGPEMKEQLKQLLENKLASITLSFISTLLMRNPLLKLSPEDIDFIKGGSGLSSSQSLISPAKILYYKLPKFIHCGHYMLFLRQSLLLFLNILHSTTNSLASNSSPIIPINVSGNSSNTPSNSSTPTSLPSSQPTGSTGVHESTDSFTLFYNHLANPKTSTTPQLLTNTSNFKSNIFNSVGQGIAVIRICSLGSNTSTNQFSLITQTKENVINDIEMVINRCLSASSVKEKELQTPVIQMEIWGREKESNINMKSLASILSTCINQSLFEYSLEYYLQHKSLTQISKDDEESNYDIEEFIEPCLKLISNANIANSPAVRELNFELPLAHLKTIPSWSITNFLSEFKNILSDLNPFISPSIFISHSSSTLFPLPSLSDQAKKNPYILYTFSKDGSITSNIPINELFHSRKGNSQVILLGGNVNEFLAQGNNSQKYCSTDSMFFPHISVPSSNSYEQIPRNCFILGIINIHGITLFTYNWNNSKLEQLNSQLSRLKYWNSMRDHLLKSIIHQKMGLFRHVPLLPSAIASDYQSNDPLSSTSAYVKFSIEQMDLIISNVIPTRSTAIKSSNDPPISSTISPVTITPEKVNPPVKSGLPFNRFRNANMATNNTNSSSNSNNSSSSAPITNSTATTKISEAQVSPAISKINFDMVLWNHFPVDIPIINVSTRIGNSGLTDPVGRHGSQFKFTAFNYSRILEQRSAFQNSVLSWFMISAAPTSIVKSPNFLQELRTVLKLSTLCFSSRVPFLFTDFVLGAKEPSVPMPIFAFSNNSIQYSSTKSPSSQRFLPTQKSNSNSNSAITTSSSNVSEMQTGWYFYLQKKSIQQYINYLQSLGFTFLHADPKSILDFEIDQPKPQTETTNNNNTENNDNVLGNASVFLQKLLSSGILIIKLSTQDIPSPFTPNNNSLYSAIMCIDLYAVYTIRSRHSITAISSSKTSKGLQFSQEIGTYKNVLLHKSLLYDFHVRNLIEYIVWKCALDSEERKGSEGNFFPPQFSFPAMELFKLIRNIEMNFNTPISSKNVLFSKVISLDIEGMLSEVMASKGINSTTTRMNVSPFEIFWYLSYSAQKYGLYSMDKCGLLPAICFFISASKSVEGSQKYTRPLSSKYLLSLLSKTNTSPLPEGKSTNAYTVLVFMVPRSNSKSPPTKDYLHLQYFVLRTRIGDKETSFPPATSQIKSEVDATTDVILSILKESISQAIVHHRKDSLWNSLISNSMESSETTPNSPASLSSISATSTSLPISNINNLTTEQLFALRQLIRCQPLHDLDVKLKPILSSPGNVVNWAALASHLLYVFGKRVRKYSFGRELHLIIFHNSSPDLFIYLIIEEKEVTSCSSYLCTKYTQLSQETETKERTLISDLINHSLFFLWKNLGM